MMLFSYVGCSTPWLTIEIIGLFHGGHLVSSMCMLLYSVHFYVVSSVCVFMTVKEFQARLGKDSEDDMDFDLDGLEYSYRLRRLSHRLSSQTSATLDMTRIKNKTELRTYGPWLKI